jgi:putative copper export protein
VAAESFTVVVVLADAIHVLAAGGWLGTLLLVAGVGIHAALRAPAGERGRVAADLVNAFSPFALACATVIALTGIIAAWTHLSGLRSLWESGYGQVLLIKLGVLAVLAALGAYNWRVQRPRLAGDASALGLRRTASAELVVGALVLAVTAVLVAMPTPDARTTAPVAQRSATP